MKAWISSVAVGILFTVSGIAISAQSEAGGGGRAEQRSTGIVDTTFRSRPRPTVKRTAPKRTAPKKTAAEYEAEGDSYYDQKDYDSALVAYENAARLKPSYRSLYRIGWIYNDFSEYAKALPALDRASTLDGRKQPATPKRVMH
jgi:Tetratricopeptide repeat.